MSRLGYAIVYVSDLERSIAFYRDVVGLPFRFASESYAEFEIVAEGSDLAPYARPAEQPVRLDFERGFGRHEWRSAGRLRIG